MLQILWLLLVLVLIAFFSGIEIAFLSANKLRIELGKNKGSLSGKILSEFNEQRSRFISTLIVGLNICMIIFTSMMANVLSQQYFPFLPAEGLLLLLIQTFFTTIIVLFLGEFFPKALFRINPDSLLSFFAIPVKYLVYYPLLPLTYILETTSKFFMKLFLRRDIEESKHEFSAIDLEYLIKEVYSQEGTPENKSAEIDTEIFEKALYLKDVKVRECMVHRMNIEAINSTANIEELKNRFIETKHSRLIVHNGNIDDIAGYVHHQELLKDPKDISSILRTLPAIPETMSARDLLYTFIRERKNMAWIIDEHGGTAGIITLEDLMEEIFGEIRDEHDEEENVEKKISDTEYMFSGALEIDYLNEKYHFDIPTGEYETLAGFILAHHESIPNINDEIVMEGYWFKVLNASDNRIQMVQMKLTEEE